jgi:hypothetical protein
MQIPRSLFTDERFLNLSDEAKWLFFVLKENEHRYSGKGEDFFYRSNSDLAKDCRWHIKKLERVKAELLTTDLVQTWKMHWVNEETGKRSEKHVTAYRILV